MADLSPRGERVRRAGAARLRPLLKVTGHGKRTFGVEITSDDALTAHWTCTRAGREIILVTPPLVDERTRPATRARLTKPGHTRPQLSRRPVYRRIELHDGAASTAATPRGRDVTARAGLTGDSRRVLVCFKRGAASTAPKRCTADQQQHRPPALQTLPRAPGQTAFEHLTRVAGTERRDNPGSPLRRREQKGSGRPPFFHGALGIGRRGQRLSQ